MLDVLVIWLELRLNPRHFCTNLKLLLRVQLGLQVLTHVPRILTLEYLFVHKGSLALKSNNVGVIGFSAAVVGGLGSIYGAIVGGLLFAFLQTLGAIWFSVPAYKDVFAFAVIIILMAWRPTGLLADRSAERV